MQKIKELLYAIIIFFITIYIEWKPNTTKLIIEDLGNKYWLLGFANIIIFILIVLHRIKEKHPENDRLIESLKKAILAFTIAYLAHLDFTLLPFCLVFIVSFFFHDWV